MIERVASHKKISLSLNTDQRAGDQVLTVKELSKAYGSKVLWQSIGFGAKRGERLGIIGPNGSGKTTLLRVLVGEDDADAGDVRWGANLNVGYYDQRLDDFDPELTVLETIAEGRPTGTREQDMRDVLATMLFRGDDIHKPVGMLSGGERARVRFAQLLMDKPNVLILDEPTNHLDIPSREALEGALSSYPGTVMCVSHDRFFLDRVAQRLLVLAPPGVDDFAGTYTAWQHKLREEQVEREALEAARAKQAKSTGLGATAATVKPKSKSSNKDNPYARPFGRLTTEELERQITDTEIAIAECQTSFGDAGSFKDASKGKTLQAEYESLAKKLEALEQEYYAREA
jgi:ATP-binding cassette subfamily F protein 3